jgi:hypothetical protein
MDAMTFRDLKIEKKDNKVLSSNLPIRNKLLLTDPIPKCFSLMLTIIFAVGAMKVLSKDERSPWNVQTNTSRACLMSMSLRCPP